MDDKRTLLKHFLAALAYRTQKALRGAPPDFASFRAGPNVRTPHELIQHMESVLGYSRTFFIGGSYRADLRPHFGEAVAHFHEVLADVARHLEMETGTLFRRDDARRSTCGLTSAGRKSSATGELCVRRHQSRESWPRSAASRQS